MRDPRFQARPVAAVNADHQSTMRVRTFRGPKRSPIHPVGISNAAYANVKALNAHAIIEGVRCSSSRIDPVAALIATRSRKVMSDRMNVKRSSVRRPRRGAAWATDTVDRTSDAKVPGQYWAS